MNALLEYGLGFAGLLALALAAAILAKGLGEAVRGVGEGAKAAADGAGKAARGIGDGAGSVLAGSLAGLGAGLGSLAGGVGAGLGGAIRGLGGALPGAGRAAGGLLSGAGKGAGFLVAGAGLGLGGAAVGGARGARSAGHWAGQQAAAAARAYAEYQAQRQWRQWHAQGAPAYAWTVGDPYVQGVMAGRFAEVGVRFDWQQDPVTGAWQVIIDAEDLDLADEVLAAVGLGFQQYGQPIGVDGMPWQPGINDVPLQAAPGVTAPVGGASVYDPDTGEWSPIPATSGAVDLGAEVMLPALPEIGGDQQ